jgi:hypothetical protein
MLRTKSMGGAVMGVGTLADTRDSDGDYLDTLLCGPRSPDTDFDGVSDDDDMADVVGLCDTREHCVYDQADWDRDRLPDVEPYGPEPAESERSRNP